VPVEAERLALNDQVPEALLGLGARRFHLGSRGLGFVKYRERFFQQRAGTPQ